MTYPIPKLFTQSLVLNEYMQHSVAFPIESDDQACRELNQIALQAEAGQNLIAFALNQLLVGKDEVLATIPIPTRITTEDGWEFELVLDELSYEAEDGSNVALVKVLELILMNPQERNNDMFPQFQVVEWTQ